MISHINLIGSILISILLLLGILKLNSTIRARSYEYTLDNLVRENTASVAELITQDFRKIGYGVANPINVFQSFDSTNVQFLSDIDENGDMDTLTYNLGSTTTLSNTPNPRDRYLTRQVNPNSGNIATNIGLGVTDFKLRYFDKDGAITSNGADIVCIQIELTVESSISCNDAVSDTIYYAQNYWQTKITPPNLIK